MTWPRPIPLVGDATSAAQRAAAPDGWALGEDVRAALALAMGARRDVRRYRPDPVGEDVLTRVLAAAHTAPSVGHSQPWRFLVVDDDATRERAAVMADRERLREAAAMAPDRAARLLDLQLEGVREAPLGVVVCCDRRTPAAGVLGRASFPDADVWSCACAIQNLWLAARAEGLGVGWVTLFDPDELAGLLGLPDGVLTLGWLCLGWPDERPPEPGLERAGWSTRLPLADVVLRNRWPGTDVAAPPSHLRAPRPAAVVGARDAADALLTPLGSLGVLDRAVDRAVALGLSSAQVHGRLVLAVGRHPVAALGVSAFAPGVGDDVLAAARAGSSVGAVAAAAAGLELVVLDGGTSTGDLEHTDPLTPAAVAALVARGRAVGEVGGLVALGEIGIGNTTVAAALAAATLGRPAAEVVGLGAGADSAILARKVAVVGAALLRPRGPTVADRLAALGGPELALLVGVVLGTAAAGGLVVLDGLATSVAALLAVELEPAVAAHLVAGQRSRERAHGLVLERLGLEPLLELRLRAGEGAGAAMATQLLRTGLRVRAEVARTA